VGQRRWTVWADIRVGLRGSTLCDVNGTWMPRWLPFELWRHDPHLPWRGNWKYTLYITWTVERHNKPMFRLAFLLLLGQFAVNGSYAGVTALGEWQWQLQTWKIRRGCCCEMLVLHLSSHG
jgi:hypothetical protein